MTTLKSALGPMAQPLSWVIALWLKGPRWKVRLVRLFAPTLAEALDRLCRGAESVLGPLA